MPLDLVPPWDETPQWRSALVLHNKARLDPQPDREPGDIQAIDVDSAGLLRPPTVLIDKTIGEDSAQAWLYGKLLVALVVEKLMEPACAISP
ncbi:MAG: hypothetical protein GKR94_04785 [Gammaproteobacteria bacterium]|nr:hypothetical protein [Gammaproteobacteria bacterium]